jgi:hypothetical protein
MLRLVPGVVGLAPRPLEPGGTFVGAMAAVMLPALRLLTRRLVVAEQDGRGEERDEEQDHLVELGDGHGVRQSRRILYWAVTSPFSGSMKWSRCEGWAEAPSPSRA